MMTEKLKSWRWPIGILLALVAGLAFAFWPEAEAVDVIKVTRGPMRVSVIDDGETRVEELYSVSAPVTGYLSRIEFEAGDTIQAGALITRMSARPASPLDRRSIAELRAAVAAARAGESSVGASLDQARRDLARVEALAGRGFVSKAQLEAARTRVVTGRAAVTQAREEVRRIEGLLATPGGAMAGEGVPVRAPVGGQVLTVTTESEGLIAEGAPLLSLGDPARIEVITDLLSREAVRVRPGDAVEITQWGGPVPLRGSVRRVEPFGRLKISALGIEEQRVNVVIALDAASAAKAARLGHGYQVETCIILWSKPDALRLPIGAFFRAAGGDWTVFVVEGGRAHERRVALGKMNDEFAEILSGLSEGAQVVVNPGRALRDGARVSPR